MNTLFNISHNSGNLHLYLFIASFVFTVLVLVVYGLRNKLPIVPWLLLIFSSISFAIIGGKLFAYNLSDWQTIITNFEFPETRNKRLLGYLLFGLIGLIITKRILRFNFAVGDAFAYAWPIGLLTTRIGCLVGGCCHGTITHLPFGITYAKGSLAYNLHQSEGLLTSEALSSLPVHPIPVYEIIFCVLLILTLHLIARKNYFKAPGNLFYLSLTIYSVFRFFEEFIRPGGEYIFGLKTVQLLVLATSIIMLFILWYREKKLTVESRDYDLQKNLQRIFLGFLSLITILSFTSYWLSASEVIVLQLLGIICFASMAIMSYQQLSNFKLQTVPFLMLITAFALMSQTLTEPLDSNIFQKKYFKISGGATFGEEEEICGGSNPYSAGGLNVEHVNQYNEFKRFTFGSQFYMVNYDGFIRSGFSPYLRLDSKWAGAGLGINYTELETSFRTSGLTPSFQLRLGRQDKFFLDGMYGMYMPGGLPAFQMGLGIGLKGHLDNYIRLGLSDGGFYVNPHIMLDDYFSIDPFVSYIGQDTYHAGLRLHYRIFYK